MTDRHAGYLVVLEKDIREDDAEQIISALRMVKGVQSVEPVLANLDQHLGEIRARSDFRRRLIKMLEEM